MAAAIEIFVGTSQDFLLSFKVKTTDDVNTVNVCTFCLRNLQLSFIVYRMNLPWNDLLPIDVTMGRSFAWLRVVNI